MRIYNVFYVSLLEKYKGEEAPLPSIVEIEEEDIYNIKKIIDLYIIDRKEKYKVK